MRLIFSKDRPAQLDLLMRSLERYAPEEETTVIYRATTTDYLAGYTAAVGGHRSVTFLDESSLDAGFQRVLELALGGETVTFFCDDDVLYRPIDEQPILALQDDNFLAFSLRLGTSTRTPGAHFSRDSEGYVWWHWSRLPAHDHGYPGSIDGHTFRTTDVLTMIEGQAIPNPLILETVLARRVSALAAERPLMACYREQALVGVNVNSVADASRTAGQVHPQPADELNRRFLDGERISLDALDFSRVDGCLVELPFEWERAA